MHDLQDAMVSMRCRQKGTAIDRRPENLDCLDRSECFHLGTLIGRQPIVVRLLGRLLAAEPKLVDRLLPERLVDQLSTEHRRLDRPHFEALARGKVPLADDVHSNRHRHRRGGVRALAKPCVEVRAHGEHEAESSCCRRHQASEHATAHRHVPSPGSETQSALNLARAGGEWRRQPVAELGLEPPLGGLVRRPLDDRDRVDFAELGLAKLERSLGDERLVPPAVESRPPGSYQQLARLLVQPLLDQLVLPLDQRPAERESHQRAADFVRLAEQGAKAAEQLEAASAAELAPVGPEVPGARDALAESGVEQPAFRLLEPTAVADVGDRPLGDWPRAKLPRRPVVAVADQLQRGFALLAPLVLHRLDVVDPLGDANRLALAVGVGPQLLVGVAARAPGALARVAEVAVAAGVVARLAAAAHCLALAGPPGDANRLALAVGVGPQLLVGVAARAPGALARVAEVAVAVAVGVVARLAVAAHCLALAGPPGDANRLAFAVGGGPQLLVGAAARAPGALGGGL